MATSTTVFALNRVKYAAFDFDTHLDELRARLQVKFAAVYNDFALASLGMMLLDVFAFGLDTLSFYLDRRATEVYLPTLRTRKGASRVSRQLGYKMGGAVSSSVDLTVRVLKPKAFVVSISEGFQFQGPNSLIFEAARQVDWTPAEQTAGVVKYVPAYEGETITESFRSSGLPNQTFQLASVPNDKSVAFGSVRMKVDGTDWKEEEFLRFTATNQYEVAYNDDPPMLRFGDSTAGNTPVVNATIAVTYVATSGQAGEALAGTITAPVADLVIAGEKIDLSINNARKSVGGDYAESIERVKANAGRVFNSRKLAIVESDYDALASAYASPIYGRVAIAKALSSRSAADDLALRDYILAIGTSLLGPTNALRAEIAAATTTTTGTLYQILSYCTVILTALSDIVTSMNTINANTAAVISGIRGNRNLTLDMDSEAEAGKAATTASAALPAEKATIIAYFDSIKTKTSLSRGAADAQVGSAGLVLDEVDKIGLSLTAVQVSGEDSYLKSAADARTQVVTIIGIYNPSNPSLSTGFFKVFQVTLVEDVADIIDPSIAGNANATVSYNLDAIYEHVDRMLAADCKANLISVPILVKDAAGFYTEPSNGLISSLRTYLDARREVTQTVEVMSGGNFLIYPWLTIRVGVWQGYSLEKTRTAVESAVDGVLRDRKFGVSLYVSDLNKVILAIEGVSFVNVNIDGFTTLYDTTIQTTKLDSPHCGNLIIEKTEVITKTPGCVLVTAETVIPVSPAA